MEIFKLNLLTQVITVIILPKIYQNNIFWVSCPTYNLT